MLLSMLAVMLLRPAEYSCGAHAPSKTAVEMVA
jgi:hypothetical protein